MRSNSFCNSLILLFNSKSSFSPAKGKMIEQNMSLTVHVFKIFGISTIMQHEIWWHCKSTLNRTTWVNYLKETKSICFKTQTQFKSDVRVGFARNLGIKNPDLDLINCLTLCSSSKLLYHHLLNTPRMLIPTHNMPKMQS